jgi:glycosyltransferase involved in cell wall biosynthesis
MRVQADKLSAHFGAARPGGVVIVTQVWAMEWVALADTSGLTVIGMSHESFEYSRTTSRFRRVQKFYEGVDRMLVLTQEDADRWIRQGLNNTGFMPNPLPFMPEVPSARTEKAVISIGRLHDQKGIDMLLDSWADVAPLHPDWTLRIYGSGEDEELLRTQCTALGLDGSVAWLGRTDDVPGALRGGSVFVQSSRGEGFPLALMEAMATALPCAAFDCAPGVREIVRDGADGLLATVGNTSELARHLDTLMSDQALRDRMGATARMNVQRFSTDAVVRRWEELFAFLER